MAAVTIQLASLASGAVTASLTYDDVTLLIQSISVTSDRALILDGDSALGNFSVPVAAGTFTQDVTSLDIRWDRFLDETGAFSTLGLPVGAQLGLREGN